MNEHWMKLILHVPHHVLSCNHKLALAYTLSLRMHVPMYMLYTTYVSNVMNTVSLRVLLTSGPVHLIGNLALSAM